MIRRPEEPECVAPRGMSGRMKTVPSLMQHATALFSSPKSRAWMPIVMLFSDWSLIWLWSFVMPQDKVSWSSSLEKECIAARIPVADKDARDHSFPGMTP